MLAAFLLTLASSVSKLMISSIAALYVVVEIDGLMRVNADIITCFIWNTEGTGLAYDAYRMASIAVSSTLTKSLILSISYATDAGNVKPLCMICVHSMWRGINRVISGAGIAEVWKADQTVLTECCQNHYWVRTTVGFSGCIFLLWTPCVVV